MAAAAAYAFDTHKLVKHFVERLTAKGMASDLATTLAEEFADGLSAVRSNPDAVSQADFREHKSETKSEIKGLATKQDVADVKQDVSDLRHETNSEFRVLRWMGGTILAGIAAVLGIAVKVLLTH